MKHYEECKRIIEALKFNHPGDYARIALYGSNNNICRIILFARGKCFTCGIAADVDYYLQRRSSLKAAVEGVVESTGKDVNFTHFEGFIKYLNGSIL